MGPGGAWGGPRGGFGAPSGRCGGPRGSPRAGTAALPPRKVWVSSEEEEERRKAPKQLSPKAPCRVWRGSGCSSAGPLPESCVWVVFSPPFSPLFPLNNKRCGAGFAAERGFPSGNAGEEPAEPSLSDFNAYSLRKQ